MIPGKTYKPQDLLTAAWRRRWWIGVPFVVLSVVAAAVVWWLPRAFQSSATIQVVSESAADAYVRTPGDTRQPDRLATIRQTTLTRTRLEGIIKDLDLYADLRGRAVMDMVLDRMNSDIIFRSSDRDVLQVGFTAPDPYVSLAVATRLTALLLEENARARGQQAEETTQFLDKQLSEVRAKLDEQEKQLESYKTKFSGELPSQLATNTQQLGNAQLVVRSLLDTIGRDQEQRLLLQRQLESVQASNEAAASKPASADGSVPAGPSDLEAARARLKALELRLTAEHPDVQRARRDVAKLEQQQAAQAPGAAPASAAAAPAAPRLADLRSRELQAQIEIVDRRTASNQLEVNRLRSQGDDYARRIAAAPTRESELATLTRDTEDTKKLYSSLMEKQKNATLAADLAKASIGDRYRVIETPRLPQKASGRSKRDLLLAGLLLALGLSVGLAAVIEYRDSSLRTEDDVTTSLRLPVLAMIPRLASAGQRRVR